MDVPEYNRIEKVVESLCVSWYDLPEVRKNYFVNCVFKFGGNYE